MRSHWREPARVSPLGRGEVQVWSLDLSTIDRARLLAGVPEILDGSEISRIGRMRSRSRIEEFAAGRILLRTLLGCHLGQAPREVSIVFNNQRRPLLAAACDLDFNLSHSHDVVLVALSRNGRVGVDVEWIDPHFAGGEELLEIARENLSPLEYNQVAALSVNEQDSDRRLRAFYAAWTRKEALVKAEGEGLTGKTSQGWAFSFDHDGAGTACQVRDGHKHSYELQTFAAAPNHVASLAFEPGAMRLRFFNSSNLEL